MTDSTNPMEDPISSVLDSLKEGGELNKDDVDQITQALIEALREEIGIFGRIGHRGTNDVGVMVKKYINGVDDIPVFIIDEERERVACVTAAYPTWAGVVSEEEGVEQVPGIMIAFDDASPLASGHHELILALSGCLSGFLNAILNNMLPSDQAKQMFGIIQSMMDNNERQDAVPAVVSTSQEVFGLLPANKIEVVRGWGDAEVGDALYPVQGD